MKPRVTYPRTVVLPKDCEELWLQVKTDNPAQSFNGWITRAVRDYYGSEEFQRRAGEERFVNPSRGGPHG